MEFEFREARLDELEDLAALINSAYRGEVSRQGWTTEADFLDGQRTDADMLMQLLEQNDATILVACEIDEDEPLGCIYLKKEKDTCWLGMLTVHPELQDQGLGSQLLEEGEAYAQFWDCTRIQMRVISLRKELIAWYQRKGYKANGQRAPFEKNNPRLGIPKLDFDFIILEKPILL